MRIATRGSALALAQAGQVAEMLGGADLVEATSDGEPGDKARFVRGVERTLLAGDAELGVHSAKDLPSEPAEGLAIAAVPPRENPADAWIGVGTSLEDVPEGARVGTASLRRRAQLLAARPDLQVSELHGNVDTRLGRLAAGNLDVIVLAVAGLRRLGRADEIAFEIPRGQMTPAPGQGALVLQARADDAASAGAAAAVGDLTALRELSAERAAVALLEADCTTPIGVHARIEAERLEIEAFVGLPDGSEWIRDRLEGEAAEPEALGRLLAERLLAAGARDILDRAQQWGRGRGGGPPPHMGGQLRHVNGGAGMSARSGVVYLVGAGPGDPGLMTVRALELIASADTIFHDRLIPTGALDSVRKDAKLVYVGKAPADGPETSEIATGSAHRQRETVPQGEINGRLIEAARAGRSVVRLKGGDPFVFGRGGEEGEALRAAGVEFEVVPGVTAGVAASAYAGIPVTHRDEASAVAFVTGHEDPEKEETALDWGALAAFPGTLVFYMGVKRLAANAATLIDAGRNADEPAAAVERGTMAGQRTVVATLGTLAEAVEREGIGAPALIVVGPVVQRRESLAWLERRPLHGRRVVVTRARAQASGLAASLRGLGAEVVELPAIRVEPRTESDEVRRTVDSIGDFALICLTSPNGANLLFEALSAAGKDARALADTTVAAIGPGTARTLAERGIVADVIPERFVAEALVKALAGVEVEGQRVLIARAAEARDVLPEALRERGAEVDVVSLYETVREQPAPTTVAAAQDADYVTFTSSSTVRNLTEALGERFPAVARIVSIGPVTSEAARAAGLTVHVEAERHDVDGLLAALLADAAK